MRIYTVVWGKKSKLARRTQLKNEKEAAEEIVTEGSRT